MRPATSGELLLPRATAHMRFLLALSIVAVGAAGFAVTFRLLLNAVYWSVFGAHNVVDAIAGLPVWSRLLVPTAGAMVAGLLARFRLARTQGVSNVMEAVALGRLKLSLRVTAWRVAGSWSAIATGLSIGREGPLIEFGGSLAATMARLFAVPLTQARVLIAAGTAAGFAAAYNTPFAAVLFVIETIVGIVALEALLPTMAATVAATMLTRLFVGGGPIYGARAFAVSSATELASYALLGVVAVAAAMAFKKTLAFGERLVERHSVPQPWRAACGGLLVGAVAIVLPNVAGNGYEPLNLILDQRLAAGAIGFLIIAKMLATTASVASGVPGGVFTPVLLVGGAIGSLYGIGLHAIGFSVAVNSSSYALVGMAAMIAATIHAPLTAALMVFELSGDYPIVLPLLLCTVIATWLSRELGGESVYESELRRRGLSWELTLDGRRLEP